MPGLLPFPLLFLSTSSPLNPGRCSRHPIPSDDVSGSIQGSKVKVLHAGLYPTVFPPSTTLFVQTKRKKGLLVKQELICQLQAVGCLLIILGFCSETPQDPLFATPTTTYNVAYTRVDQGHACEVGRNLSSASSSCRTSWATLGSGKARNNRPAINGIFPHPA